MTQKEKNLLLKDLCARLPYGIKISKVIEVFVSEPRPIRSINLNNIIVEDGEFEDGTPDIDVWNYEDIKPYLFPLSSMSEEERMAIGNEFAYGQPQKAMDILHKRHIDFNGLIPRGLAIDATGLNIY